MTVGQAFCHSHGEKRSHLFTGRSGDRGNLQAIQDQPEEAGSIASPVFRQCAVGLGVKGSFRFAGGTQGVVFGSARCD